jgi:hypothetical protein
MNNNNSKHTSKSILEYISGRQASSLSHPRRRHWTRNLTLSQTNIRSRQCKHSPFSSLSFLQNTLTDSLKSCQVPIVWEEVNVTPVLKDGKTVIPDEALHSINRNKVALKGETPPSLLS